MKKAVAALILLGVLIGCSTKSAEQSSSLTPTNDASSTEQPADTITIPETKQFQLKYTTSSIAKPLSQITTIDDSMQLSNQPVDESIVVIYEKNEDENQIYAALQTKVGTYEIGQIGYKDSSDYSINSIEALGQIFIKLTGSIGANAPISEYVSPITSPPTRLHIEANTVEADVDQDGIKEIVGTVGTVAETTIYKMENNSLVSANLNEIMNAPVVIYDLKSNIFQAEIVQGQLSNWRIFSDYIHLTP